ncbi:MAG: TlpA family protein disulfide reductase [Planctomycetes bacterium]|nr:TlpA family protein disulfide reductase [Planctomycetota bacterium]
MRSRPIRSETKPAPQRSAVSTGFLIVLACFALGTARSPQSSPEQTLWSEIQKLGRANATTQPAAARFEARLARRRSLLSRLRQYGTVYPGGAHRAESVRLELLTLFEIGSLTGGAYDELRRQVKSSIEHPPCEGAEHEAAYWAVLLDHMDREDQRQRAATSQPAQPPQPARPSRAADSAQIADRLAAYASYVERYPDSRYSVAFREALFEQAAAAGDRNQMTKLVAQLRINFPAHLITRRLGGRLQRDEAVGRPFWLTFTDRDKKTIDTRVFVGSPVLIVAWDSSRPACRTRLKEVEAFRRRHHEVRVFGVNLDQRRTEMAATADDFEIRWPQFNDGRGPANEFARTWGVSRVPLVFVIDRRGRLLGSSGDDAWKALAEQALED